MESRNTIAFRKEVVPVEGANLEKKKAGWNLTEISLLLVALAQLIEAVREWFR